ncbi:aspartate/glutamate racemase family protein [Lachnoclostridium sp. Marseille-P6806]|uniref:aspartate/glutamate racemase family protein n=1 Tax=Lachnoclostridium sp. Marseille-P6806 TaxID=2364793 RepID=UPI00102FEBA8|nr:aspartate/glutamate racemase family protein [Lachnoclostridium sp. Marseille-P6806]
MKVGIVYTSTTPELKEDVNRELRRALGEEIEIYAQEDPSILAEVRENGYVTAAPAARLFTMFMNAVQENCDAVLNVCSSVGEAADSMQDAAKYLGVPIVRIDEEMCREAVRRGRRIGVMATLPTTLAPTCSTIRRAARECGMAVEITECLVDGAFGLNQEAFRERMGECADRIADSADVIVLAQGSMAYCESYLAERCRRPVLSSPRFGAAALRRALQDKGTLMPDRRRENHA